jgi:hypothetical protein
VLPELDGARARRAAEKVAASCVNRRGVAWRAVVTEAGLMSYVTCWGRSRNICDAAMLSIADLCAGRG